MADKKTSDNSIKSPSLKSRLVCGTVVSLINQGCGENLELPTDSEQEILQETVQKGDEFFYPVLVEMAKVADQKMIFGMNGESGQERFLSGLDKTKQNLSEMVQEKRVFTFSDLEYSGSAFYRNRGVLGQDLIGINTAFLIFFPADQPFQARVDGRVPLNYSDLMHESSHNWCGHSPDVEAYVLTEDYASGIGDKDYVEKLLIENEDYAYQLSASFDGLESFFRYHVISFDKYYSWLEGTKNNIETGSTVSNNDYYNDYFDQLSTPEGWADLTIQEDSLDFLSDFWGVPLAEQKRIIAESGWYEVYVEEGMKEFVVEARAELGLENPREREPRETDFQSMRMNRK